MRQIPGIYLRQLFLLLLIGAIFGILFWNLRFFLPALLGAYTLYVLLRGVMFFLTGRWQWPRKLAAAVLMLVSFVAILLPVNWVFGMLRDRVGSLFQNSDSLLQNAERIIRGVEERYGISLLTPDNMRNFSEWGATQLQGIVGATFSGLGILVIAYVILWFMLAEAKNMEHSFFDWLPLKEENVEYVRVHLNNMVYANALGIPLMGLVQGLAGLLIYWLAGVRDPWLWFAVTFFAGMMPIFGVALAYVPLSLILLAEGQDATALLIFLYGFIVVGSVDNLARMWLLKKIGHTHPLITLFGVIVGLKLFGFIGFIFGPILISLFILLLKIYQKEFDRPAATTQET
ncbi:MAG: AI-2E family transporter [Saprospiraceae bacterium]|nr:AI-2E family transporter [Saprospiraceae bacterium]MCB9355982.1 AI-2E family transporter [Lewinellaceae bacterium]